MTFDLTDLVLQIPFGVGSGLVPSIPVIEFKEDPVAIFTEEVTEPVVEFKEDPVAIFTEEVTDQEASDFVFNDDDTSALWIDSKHMTGEVNYIDYAENWAGEAAEQIQLASATIFPIPVSDVDYDNIGPTEYFTYGNYSDYNNNSNVISEYLEGNVSSSGSNNDDEGNVSSSGSNNDDEGNVSSSGSNNDIAPQTNELVWGGSGQNIMDGASGNDFLIGNNSGDFIRGGIGHDVLLGGEGSDWLWGGSGQNILDPGSNDGAADHIFVYSDKHLNPNGNPDGIKRDLLINIEELDAIFIHGVDDSTLSFIEGITDPAGSGLQGVGIYAEDSLEAFVAGTYTAEQIDAITVGGVF